MSAHGWNHRRHISRKAPLSLRDKILHNIQTVGSRLLSLGWGSLGNLVLICRASSSPCTHPFGDLCWTYHVLFFPGLYSYWVLHLPSNFALLKFPCFLLKDFFYPFERMHCTLYTTRLDSIEFYYFICNYICVYFPLRSLKTRSISCVFMYIPALIQPLESMLHTVCSKWSRNF